MLQPQRGLDMFYPSHLAFGFPTTSGALFGFKMCSRYLFSDILGWQFSPLMISIPAGPIPDLNLLHICSQFLSLCWPIVTCHFPSRQSVEKCLWLGLICGSVKGDQDIGALSMVRFLAIRALEVPRLLATGYRIVCQILALIIHYDPRGPSQAFLPHTYTAVDRIHYPIPWATWGYWTRIFSPIASSTGDHNQQCSILHFTALLERSPPLSLFLVYLVSPL